MAATGENTAPMIITFAQTSGGRNLFLMLGIAAVIGVMASVWMWGQQPDYRVLFSNFSDRDGGAIVASLQQQNIPYKYAEGGGAILVPANQVHDARLKLAAQGLPKGGNVGFELIENQKLGTSQFLEQINFQRALEGELARSIESLSSVQAARVHLALPKASVFVREQQKPTASVILNLHAGRSLDQPQVNAIVHLVASSVGDLPPGNVTIVDQNGNLLSDTSAKTGANTLDPTQLKYVQDLQQNIVKRIESIITPIVGANNVRAEATADVDFSHTEQAAETYKPNQQPDASVIRSQQSNESLNGSSSTGASGVPGALTNQPPPNTTAPVNAPAGAPAVAASAANAGNNSHKELTVNYEVDKTVKYVQQPMGGVRRLSVAVVVNYKREVEKGKVLNKPLSEAEKAQITDLVKEAMGFNKDRGDSLNVVNSPFATPEKEVIVEPPFWKNPGTQQTAKDTGKFILMALILAYLFFKVLKPTARKISENMTSRAYLPAADDRDRPAPRNLQQSLDAAKQLARQDPKVVANVVKTWVNGNE